MSRYRVTLTTTLTGPECATGIEQAGSRNDLRECIKGVRASARELAEEYGMLAEVQAQIFIQRDEDEAWETIGREG